MASKASEPSTGPLSRDVILRFLLGAAALAVLAFTLNFLAALLIPFLQAGFITIVALHPVTWLTKKRVPHTLAVLLTGFWDKTWNRQEYGAGMLTTDLFSAAYLVLLAVTVLAADST